MLELWRIGCRRRGCLEPEGICRTYQKTRVYRTRNGKLEMASGLFELERIWPEQKLGVGDGGGCLERRRSAAAW